MPNIYINGSSIPDGSSSIPNSNSITFSWDSLNSDFDYTQNNTYIKIKATNSSGSGVSMSFASNTGISNPDNVYLDRYGDISDYAEFAGYTRVGPSGNINFTFGGDMQGGKIYVDVVVSSNIVQQSEVSVIQSDPIITGQPVLSLGAQSGAAVQMTWTAATVEYLDTATIYYQYFVGPSSTYSDSYHVGTTTGLSHTMTEAEIISKCGNGFGASSSGSICYLFVRAYWQKGSQTGGWSTPTGKAFTYIPTVNPPTSISCSPVKGKSTQITWTNSKAGNNSDQTSIVQVLRNGSWTTLATGAASPYSISESTWSSYGRGTYALRVVHEYYGRYANGNQITFEYAPYYTVRVSGKDCVAYVYRDNKWVPCEPYAYYSGQWRLCSTT